MGLLLTYLFLALSVSFLCSIMEAVLLTTPNSYIIVKKQEGAKWALMFEKFKEEVDRPLSAILSMNTCAHTIGAAGVGAQATKVFGEEYFGLVSAILTILILVVTEIVPKTIGAMYWKSLSSVATKAISTTIFISYPLVLVSSMITKLISKNKVESSTSREEISALAKIGSKEGILLEKEEIILQNILKLKNVKAKDVMTPRVVLVMANQNMSLNEFLDNKDYLKFTRIPIYNQNDENITGYVIRGWVFENIAENKKELTLEQVKRDIIVAPSSIKLYNLWEKMLTEKEHIALMVDEYGGVDGVVTMEDIIETILGLEIVDEKDDIVDMQKYAKERWEERQHKNI